MNPTKNWRIRYAEPNDPESFFFVEADLEKDGHYPRIEVMQEDFGDHNGYDRETRLADANLIVAAPKLLEALKVCFKSLSTYGSHPIIEQQVKHALYLAESEKRTLKPLREIVNNRSHLKELFEFVTGAKMKNKQTSDNKKFCIMYSSEEDGKFFSLYFDGSILHGRDLRNGVTYFDVVDKIRELGYNVKAETK